MLNDKRSHYAAKKENQPMYNVAIGMDLGDKKHQIHILDAEGKTIKVCQISNTAKALNRFFSEYPKALVAIEASTHSPWISRLLEEIVAKVLIGNPRKLRMIWDSDQKDDMRDAEMLARIARFDPKLLYPISHRDEQCQADRSLLKSRDILVKVRTTLVLHIRGSVKSMGGRLASCSTDSFHKKVEHDIPADLKFGLQPVLDQIRDISGKIKELDKIITEVSQKRYPATNIVQQVGRYWPRYSPGVCCDYW